MLRVPCVVWKETHKANLTCTEMQANNRCHYQKFPDDGTHVAPKLIGGDFVHQLYIYEYFPVHARLISWIWNISWCWEIEVVVFVVRVLQFAHKRRLSCLWNYQKDTYLLVFSLSKRCSWGLRFSGMYFHIITGDLSLTLRDRFSPHFFLSLFPSFLLSFFLFSFFPSFFLSFLLSLFLSFLVWPHLPNHLNKECYFCTWSHTHTHSRDLL